MTVTYPLATSSWDDKEIEAMQHIIDSGMFTMGEKVAEFENKFAQFVGAKYCIMVNSGSSANLLMVAAMRYRKDDALMPGDEVIVPAVSWSTTYYPLHQYGLKLKFIDIDKHTLNYDIDKLEAAITGSTKAIMIVNLLGNPNNFNAINKLAAGKDIILLEDNCESMGAIYNGQQAGTFGLMGSFSSFFSHHISTMEGGMIVTDDEELYHILLSLRSHGWTRHLPKENKVCETKSDDPFKESFRFVLPGYNVRPLELSGAIGIEQVDKLPLIIEGRKNNAKKFIEVINQFDFLRPQKECGESSWFGFSIIVDKTSPVERNELIRKLTGNGIEVRPIVAGNFTKNEAMKWMDYSIHGSLENADEIGMSGFFIGNHHYDIVDEINILSDVLKKI